MLPKICILTTGGTIAMRDDDTQSGAKPAVDGKSLVSGIPDCGQIADIFVKDMACIPSPHIDEVFWYDLAKRVEQLLSEEDIDGLVIVHGTDTMEETAWFLDLVNAQKKPVVMTGAQRPASHPAPDGPNNVRNAIRVASSSHAKNCGVLVVMGNDIHTARDVRKCHTSALPGFSSGSDNPVGYVDEKEGVKIGTPPRAQETCIPLSMPPFPRVDIISTYAGATGDTLLHALKHGAKGIIINAFGAGNIPPGIADAVQMATAAGTVIVIATEIEGGTRPAYGYHGGGKSLQDMGACFAGTLSAKKARISTMLCLAANISPKM